MVAGLSSNKYVHFGEGVEGDEFGKCVAVFKSVNSYQLPVNSYQ